MNSLTAIEKIFEKDGIWVILGVIVGFILSEGYHLLREFNKKRRVKKALIDELEINFYLINQKKNILHQMIQALEKEKILPGDSVHSVSNVYTTQISLLSEFLKPTERDSLHVIYERLRVSDKIMDDFYSQMEKELKSGVIEKPFLKNKNTLTEVSVNYSIVQNLIEDFRAGKPNDVFYRHGKKWKDYRKP